jgi:hypothetical protein
MTSSNWKQYLQGFILASSDEWDIFYDTLLFSVPSEENDSSMEKLRKWMLSEEDRSYIYDQLFETSDTIAFDENDNYSIVVGLCLILGTRCVEHSPNRLFPNDLPREIKERCRYDLKCILDLNSSNSSDFTVNSQRLYNMLLDYIPER